MADYYTLLTTIGRAKLANAHVTGVAVQITEFAVGDGGGVVYNPAEDATGLAGETFRAAPNQIYTDPDNPSWLVIEAVVPETTGGFYVREAGVFDIDGDMIAIAKYPETYKPTLAEGSGKDLYVRMVLEFSNTSDVVLKIDPAIVLATRKHVTDQIAAHAVTRDHPAATTDAQGMVELATLMEVMTGTDEARPVVPATLRETMERLGLWIRSDLVSPHILSDLNETAIVSGISYASAATVNKPPGVAEGHVLTMWAYAGYGRQVVYDRQSDDIWTRRIVGYAHQAWAKVALDGDMDDALLTHESATNPHPQYARLSHGASFGGNLAGTVVVRAETGSDSYAYLGSGYEDDDNRGVYILRYGSGHPFYPARTRLHLGWRGGDAWRGGAIDVRDDLGAGGYINISPPTDAPPNDVRVSGSRILTEADGRAIAVWESPALSTALRAQHVLAHDLGGIPIMVTAVLHCLSADGGYSPGDRLIVAPGINETGANERGMSVVVTDSALRIRISANGFSAIDPIYGVAVWLTPASWNLYVRAFT